MLIAILIVIAVVGVGCAVFSPEKPATVVEHHHHHVTVIECPVYVQAQFNIIQAEIALAESKKGTEPVRLPEARLLLSPSTAIERYRSQERKPS